MEIRIFLYCLIMSTFIISSRTLSTCTIQDVNNVCNYTVVCEHQVESVRMPDCYEDPYLTFNVTNSYADTLTSNFFRSTSFLFDIRIRVINGKGNVWRNIGTNAFRYYFNCVIMDLSENHIVNITNDAFLNLQRLEELNLSGNNIETINTRSFNFVSSQRVTHLTTNLKILDLSSNEIKELHANFSNYLSTLNVLYLQNNKLTAMKDGCFENLNLIRLYLQHNQLPSLNSTLGKLKSLMVLDVSYNSLTKIFGYEINKLTSLEYINMSYNGIETIESNCFNQALNLQTVDLRSNKIKSPIETAMFINNNKLTYLNLCENSIITLQDNAFVNKNLTFLNLEKNQLSIEITENTFSGLLNQSIIDFSNQNILAVRNDSFKFSGLLNLNLSRNQISLIENASFSKAYSLIVLDLSNNINISNLNFLRNCLFNLTELYLRNNSLTIIPKNSFDNKTLLKTLDISMNRIITIEQNSLPLNSLQFLYIEGNGITGTLQRNIFSPANFLRYLDLSHFKLSKIDEMALVDLPLLTTLNMSHSKIQQFNANNFKNMDNILSVDLSYNEIWNFNVNINLLSKCQALYLNNNKLTYIFKSFSNMTSLFYVDLSHNEIADLYSVTFSKLPNLKVLNLSFNKIKTFNNPETNSIKTLANLTLSSNQLTTINLSYFKDLVLVDLSNNSLSRINISFFENLEKLQSLDLSYNDLTDVAPAIFQDVGILKILNLSHNQLSKIRYGTFKGLNKIEILDLSYNKLVDIDVHIFYDCRQLKSLKIDYNYIKNFDVDQLVYITPALSSLSWGGNKMSCKDIVKNKYKYDGRLEVTSIDKIYHENNVHGIVCGDNNVIIPTEHAHLAESKIIPQGTSPEIITLCSILTILGIFVAVAAVWYRRNQFKVDSFRELREQLSGSLNFEGTELQHDLL